MANHRRTRVHEVADGLFHVEGPASNWIIARDGTDFTLFDGGYPADTNLVLESIEHVGLTPSKARALMVTHGHSDHTGAAAYFSSEFATPVLCHPAEVPQLRGEVKHQVTLGQVLARAWNPRVGRWAAHAVVAGGLKTNDVQGAEAWVAADLANLPGGPVLVPTPGHTPGHAAYLLPGAGALVTGDALVTGHAISTDTGPQMLHPMFHHRPGEAREALDVLGSIRASLLLPGHGPAVEQTPASAIAALWEARP